MCLKDADGNYFSSITLQKKIDKTDPGRTVNDGFLLRIPKYRLEAIKTNFRN